MYIFRKYICRFDRESLCSGHIRFIEGQQGFVHGLCGFSIYITDIQSVYQKYVEAMLG